MRVGGCGVISPSPLAATDCSVGGEKPVSQSASPPCSQSPSAGNPWLRPPLASLRPRLRPQAEFLSVERPERTVGGCGGWFPGDEEKATEEEGGDSNIPPTAAPTKPRALTMGVDLSIGEKIKKIRGLSPEFQTSNWLDIYQNIRGLKPAVREDLRSGSYGKEWIKAKPSEALNQCSALTPKFEDPRPPVKPPLTSFWTLNIPRETILKHCCLHSKDPSPPVKPAPASSWTHNTLMETLLKHS
ncbi:uncharacterized protein LOC120638355 [Ornithorhynchus anatinus]|uniref:uncharacterized protein LOC120638355 n=1 Tax=Ornithorhynchus anatinus TaxID=9258 RepID=UPI0019D430C3|nr:uncharacterized protein LOC120638355 [Ornithorhynchus anatinus]